MPYTINFESDAWQDLKALRKGEQVKILKVIETHLIHDPTRQSKSRIKQLQPGSQPPYRLRVDDFRVFYDVERESQIVIVYGVVRKEHALDWLADFVRKNAGRAGN